MAARAVVLLSGGIDSATSLAVAKERGYDAFALSVDYGQRHRIELDRAATVARALGALEHRTVTLDLRAIGGSALTSGMAVPKHRSPDDIGRDIPVTYVPARNTIFLGVALGYAETVEAFDLFLGANALDFNGYPDCRPAFLEAFEKLANLATKAAIEGAGRFKIHAPLIRMTKAEIIREGVRLGVDYAPTLSCYDPDAQGRACGACDACVLRRDGFAEAGIPDPTEYSVSG